MDWANQIRLSSESTESLYKQVADSIAALIEKGDVQLGERLPATRELAGLLGLNRTTISAAYATMEQAGLIQGHVGRGSFVAGKASSPVLEGPDWNALLPGSSSVPAQQARNIEISFASSRPACDDFPIDIFRRLARQVIDSEAAADILQLGSPHGYLPLRRYLLEESLREGAASPADDLMITNGCQQALDLLARLLVKDGTRVAIEDPVYHGLLRVLGRAGAELLPVPVGPFGMELDALEEAIARARPKLLIVTPSFQNPTGWTMPLDRRKRLLEIAGRNGLLLIENDIYSQLRYSGTGLPTLKELDESGSTVLLRSYSKVAFPGLRVGWVVGPRALIAQLAEAKQTSDLHSDQLSQAVILRFAESGELARHLERTRTAGAERLRTALQACEAFLPDGAAWTKPEGGMSLWVNLPSSVTAEQVLNRAVKNGVDFLPGNYFSFRAAQRRGFRLSFGGLAPEAIRRGIRIIGEAASAELARNTRDDSLEPAAALV